MIKSRAGGYVYAGTVAEEGECIIEVTKESGTGKYDQIVRMIEESEKLKSNTETKAYQLADATPKLVEIVTFGDNSEDEGSEIPAEADVGIAIADGAAIAREIADITVASDSLRAIVDLRRISTGLMKRIHSNYQFILSFNTALIGLGVAGVLTPSMSALLHNASTVITGAKSRTNVLEDL